MSVCALIMLILQNLQCNLHFAWGQGCYLGVQLHSFFKVDAQTEKESIREATSESRRG